MAILVTGGAGFIGANFILDWFKISDETVVNLDKLTYAGNLQNLDGLKDDPRHIFVRGSIGDRATTGALLEKYRPRAILNFAAESHVDRSIDSPLDFIQTNIVETFHLLETARIFRDSLGEADRENFRFLHVSTDEVYGSLSPTDAAFAESNQYRPNSPYSASKAASDHFVRAYHHTYALPVLTTNCSNNYGPYQFPEKLIPLMIHRALSGDTLPVYGDGLNIRDWLYVTDHCAAIRCVLEKGVIGKTYNIGGNSEKTNLDVVHILCDILDAEYPKKDGRTYRDKIVFVQDRPGHDRRYAIDAQKISRELGWTPDESFETGIAKTVRWYLDNPQWIENVATGAYRDWIEKQYTA